MKRGWAVCWIPVLALAQLPSGTISGIVRDPSGAAVPHARVTVTNTETGVRRVVETASDGSYGASFLVPTTYDLRAEAVGFAPVDAQVQVSAGGTMAFDLTLTIEQRSERVDVIAAAPHIAFEGGSTGGVVSRYEIENLPLNGRDFRQLAMLEPGVTVSPNTLGRNTNSMFDISVLGANSGRTRVTVDGGSTQEINVGGYSLGVSQEVVQEFQVSTANFDLATGRTAAGAVNIVTRSGGNHFHGSSYYYFRDHHMSAYPALIRDSNNPDPFFARRQEGAYTGGPIRKDRFFFFANLEHTNQKGVVSVQPRLPEFAGLGVIYPSRFNGTRISARWDLRASANHNAFWRYTHDGSSVFAPTANPGLPSNWRRINNWSDQSLGALTSVLGPSLVNDLRFAYSYYHLRAVPPSAADCPDCVGLGFPPIAIAGAGVTLGNNVTSPVGFDERRYEWSENLAWHSGPHSIRYGALWEHYNNSEFYTSAEPASMVLYSPRAALRAGLPVPTSFTTIDDILRLPLSQVLIGLGDPGQTHFGQHDANRDDLIRPYFEDSWRVRPRFSINYGLAYAWQRRGLNPDLPKPTYLIPIFGAGGLAPSDHNRNKWAPSAGFAWMLTADGRTVLRAGAGIYHDVLVWGDRNGERVALAPRGNGRVLVPGSAIPNPLAAIPGVLAGTPLDFQTGPTAFAGVDLIRILPAIRAGLLREFGDPSNSDLSVRNIDVFKSANGLLSPGYTTPYAEHFDIGIQREVTRDLVINADFVFRQFIHLDTNTIDFNLWNSIRGPVIQACSDAQRNDPKALCSAGEIGVATMSGRAHYKGLVVRVEKRLSHRFQLLASYAFSSNVGLNGVRNKFDWFDSFGPLDTDHRHVFTVSGVIELPFNFQASFISSAVSRPPFSAVVGNVDFNGDGTFGDVLPGLGWNQLGRSVGKADLARLVNQYNGQISEISKIARGNPGPLTLPANFDFGDSLISQDLRLSKRFTVRERYQFTVLGEVFNLFNVANLSGYGNDLTQPASFGQPSARVYQVFGSGGPRAFQLAARLRF